MSGDKELIDRLLAEYKSPEEIVGLLKQLTKAIVERASALEGLRAIACRKKGTAWAKRCCAPNPIARLRATTASLGLS